MLVRSIHVFLMALSEPILAVQPKALGRNRLLEITG
jgi:hypothetical protein